MRKNIYNFVTTSDKLLNLKGPILEIGSLRIPEQLDLPLYKDVFKGRDYIGCDMRPGIGVDRVENAENLNFPNESFKTVLILDVIEHVAELSKVMSEAERVLAKDGIILITSVFNYKIHNSPSDYWRFTPASLSLLLKNFPKKIIGYHGPTRMPQHVFGIGFKDKNNYVNESILKSLSQAIEATELNKGSLRDKIYRLKKAFLEIFSSKLPAHFEMYN